MPILAPIKAPNGAAIEYHRLIKADLDFERGFALLGVLSYASEADFLQGVPNTYAWQHSVGIDTISGEDLPHANMERVLTLSDHLPFYGGQRIADNANTLDAAKDRAWTAVKVERARRERGNFLFEGGLYYADKEQITGSATAAFMSKSMGIEYNETWTLVDNTTRVLNTDQVIALGLSLRAFVSGVYARGRELRQMIADATTIEEVAAITWEIPIG